MTDPLAWREAWSLRIDSVDAEHRELVERFAQICRSFGAAGAPRGAHMASALLEALDGLGEAAREHFRREEDLMAAIGYEDIAEHRTEHALLMAEYADLVRRWSQKGRPVLDSLTQETIRDWILDHILGADREFATAFHTLKGQCEALPEGVTRAARRLIAVPTDP
jgi:hemerythrin-like metal-binding protein